MSLSSTVKRNFAIYFRDRSVGGGCSLENAEVVPKHMCDGKRNCWVYHNLFHRDPCPTKVKYSVINYICEWYWYTYIFLKIWKRNYCMKYFRNLRKMHKSYHWDWDYYCKVSSSRPVYYSILDTFGQRSRYKSIKFPLHKESENPWTCYYPRQSTACDFTVFVIF